MTERFNGLGMSLGNLSRLSDAETRSISAENSTGAKGQGGKATEGTSAIAATTGAPPTSVNSRSRRGDRERLARPRSVAERAAAIE